MGLLEQQKELETKLKELDKKLHFCKGETILAYIMNDGAIYVRSDNITSKKDSIELCQWYLSVCEEL